MEETAGATPSTTGPTASMTEETAVLRHYPPKRYAGLFPDGKLLFLLLLHFHWSLKTSRILNFLDHRNNQCINIHRVSLRIRGRMLAKCLIPIMSSTFDAEAATFRHSRKIPFLFGWNTELCDSGDFLKQINWDRCYFPPVNLPRRHKHQSCAISTFVSLSGRWLEFASGRKHFCRSKLAIQPVSRRLARNATALLHSVAKATAKHLVVETRSVAHLRHTHTTEFLYSWELFSNVDIRGPPPPPPTT